MRELTKKEKNAIACLRRLAKRWPKTLTLFSASGTLCVMDKATEMIEGEIGYNPDTVIEAIHGIENDGGGW